MRVAHVELKEANTFVEKHHRHHKPVVGHRFSIGAMLDEKLVGVCIVGRPVARMSCQRTIVEVTRLCTDGTRNACSFLYGAAVRAARALGYAKIQTFVLDSEHGSSLKASGWTRVASSGGGTWNRPSRGGRREDQPLCGKTKWEKEVSK